MTSEVEALKTNEFLRRRKLRIQQVREQSKDIAKKIRQRANAEKFKHIVDLNSTKGKEYLEQQNKLIRKLEFLHAKSSCNVGASHRNAVDVAQENPEKVDLSKQRAREAAAELRRKKQVQLDERKKLLDRKLHARETANEISREKSSSVVSKYSKTSQKLDIPNPEAAPEQTPKLDLTKGKETTDVVTSDMATQSDFDLLPNVNIPNEWEPHVPTLTLPKNDNPEDTASKNPASEGDTTRRPNLFALSDEMPSSLRGTMSTAKPMEKKSRESLNLVSEFIKNRDLRLRDYDSGVSSKKPCDDLQSIKQTIQRTRASKVSGSLANPVHVTDVQVIPVPSWRAELNSSACTQPNTFQPLSNQTPRKFCKPRKTVDSATNSEINDLCSSFRTTRNNICPSPVLRGSSPFRRSKVYPGAFSAKPVQEKPGHSKVDCTEIALGKKSSVTMYNHSTRDVKDVPYGDKKLVMRDQNSEEDAYTQAMKEASFEKVSKERDHQKKLQDMRNKIAMTKQNIEKEFNDTMSFLKSLPKDKSKPIRNAFKDDFQQEHQKELRQKKLQYEFKKVQKECSKHSQTKKVPIRPKLKVRNASDEDFDAHDSQYSWMPVPESDGGLAIHIIPTKVKENKCGNTVRFSKIDSYHEYRSRHKHTPPTKDTCEPEKTKVVETESTDDSDADRQSASSDNVTSSVEDLRLEKEPKSGDDDRLSDAERIIVYKILKSKADKKKPKKKGSKIDIAKSLSFVSKECQVGPNRGEVGDHNCTISERRVDRTEVERSHEDAHDAVSKHGSNRGHGEVPDQVLPFETVQEGVYRTVSKKGADISAIQVRDTTPHNTTCKRDVYTDNRHQQNSVVRVTENNSGDKDVNANKKLATASSMSFNTAYDNIVQVSPKTSHTNSNDKPDTNGGFIQLVDEKGQESGKFYIGATGFLKDDNYEVVIQVRKTDKKETEPETQAVNKENTQASGVAQSLANDYTEISTAEKPAYQPLSPGTEPGSVIYKNKVYTQENVNPTFEEKMVGVTEDDIVQPVMYQTPRYIDRSVDVPFQDSFESSAAARPEPRANSVSVQTLIDSSDTRPALLRLSSSASTTYLSPPELVLPQFLKHSRHKTRWDSDFYFPFKRSHRVNTNEEYVGKHSSPNRKKQTKTPNKSMSPSSFSQRTNNIITPPNTARSNRINNYNDNGRKKKKSKKIRKCAKHDPIAYLKTYTQKVKKAQPLVPPSSRCSERISIESGKGNLSPIMKWYVDKLLAMNKEGLRTIAVLNQSCSEVTTPGSSIVDDPGNIKNDKHRESARISLEQLKFAIAEEVFKQYEILNNKTSSDKRDRSSNLEVKGKNICKFSLRFPRNKSVHKVKSLNISRLLLPKNKYSSLQKSTEPVPPASSYKGSDVRTIFSNRTKSTLSASQNISNKIPRTTWSSTETNAISSTKSCVLKNSDKIERQDTPKESEIKSPKNELSSQNGLPRKTDIQSVRHESVGTSQTQPHPSSLHTSTQTNVLIDNEIKSIKEAENKIQNMEKIANLTDKCTKRLSNLVRVLEEVRKNKLPYNQVSESPSDTDHTDQTSGKNSDTHLLATSYEPIIEIKEKSPRMQGESCPAVPLPTQPAKSHDISGTQSFVPLLKYIAKPINPNPLFSPAKDLVKHSTTNQPIHNARIQSKSKPPPALPRCLRRTSEFAVPHELSTVLEVDSPMSKHKGQTHTDINSEGASKPVDNEKPAVIINDEFISNIEPNHSNPDVLPPRQFEEAKISTDSSDDTKMQMMDLQQFNEIMLKPFISIQEYAKQCNIANIDEGSNIENTCKDDVLNEDLSSLHSDGSLPDVIAELLKRNIITEPFKFETVSNINSTSMSSDSTLSVLALSKMKIDKKSNELTLNKDNVEESSDSMSISSNPDLENAFKKLGMGWASSTLKKTKERLALSSSSNTSSSSLSQYKFKSTKNGEFPVLVTDSMSSIKNVSHIPRKQRSSNENKNSFQTSIATSMTVKQFLTEELAKRITFGEKPNETEEEFVSLYETKMPEDIKKSNRRVFCEERSIDSNSRARTSTPVQIYKSINYQSSSSSNVSNGLFSNVEDLSSVKGSTSFRNQSASEKDDLTVPNFSLRTRKGTSEGSKSDD